MDPIEAMTLNDLFNEIEKRTKAAVLVVIGKENLNGGEEVGGWYHGGCTTCVGLTQRQLWRFQDLMRDDAKRVDRNVDDGA